MKRRTFLQSLGALALTPALPSASLARIVPQAASTGAAVSVDAATYQWAEVIVRAHNKSSVAMLQRLLRLSPSEAIAMQNQLVARGVLVAQANELGIRTAVKPFNEDAFLKPTRNVSTDEIGKQLENETADTSIQDDEDARRLMIAAVDAEITINPNYLIAA